MTEQLCEAMALADCVSPAPAAASRALRILRDRIDTLEQDNAVLSRTAIAWLLERSAPHAVDEDLVRRLARAASVAIESGGLDAKATSVDKLAIALILNRGDWIALRGYSIGEAVDQLDRLSPDWLPALVTTVQMLNGRLLVDVAARARLGASRDSDAADSTVVPFDRRSNGNG